MIVGMKLLASLLNWWKEPSDLAASGESDLLLKMTTADPFCRASAIGDHRRD
jgi:hypothetical protein